MDIISYSIGIKLSEIRKRQGFSQDDLAVKVGLSRPSIVNLENGKQSLSLLNLYKITEALNIEPSELLPSKEWFKENKNKTLKKIVVIE